MAGDLWYDISNVQLLENKNHKRPCTSMFLTSWCRDMCWEQWLYIKTDRLVMTFSEVQRLITWSAPSWVSGLFWNLEIPYVDRWMVLEVNNDRMFLTFLRLKLGPSSFVSGEPIRAFYTIREGLEIFSGPPKIQILNKTLSLFFISN